MKTTPKILLVLAAICQIPFANAQLTDPDSTRIAAIEKVAYAAGLSNGTASESLEIRMAFESASGRLDAIYDFSSLMMSPTVLPPVIETISEEKGSTTYKIVKLARIVDNPNADKRISPVTWRNYLLSGLTDYDAATQTIRDTSQMPTKLEVDERPAWREHFQIGRADGIKKMRGIVKTNFDTLTAEYKGMRTYKALAEAGAAPPISE